MRAIVVERSLLIMKEAQRKDERITIIDQVNQGQGIARNNGFEASTGKYIVFVDADDYYVDLSIIEKMVEKMEGEDSSLVIAGALLKEIDGTDTAIQYDHEFALRFDRDHFAAIDLILDSRTMVSCCNKMYRAEVIRENNLHFETYGVVFSEDTLFNYCYLTFSARNVQCQKVWR